jgi:hypothetical protein
MKASGTSRRLRAAALVAVGGASTTIGGKARSRRLLLAVIALTLLATGISPAAFADHLPVNSDPDSTGPSLESFAISPTSVDVRVASANIAASAHITDDKSGVADVTVHYRSPSGAELISFRFTPGNRTSGTAHVGDYDTSITVDGNRESGTWRVGGASTRDVVGNTRGYTAAQALALGAVDFTVQSNRDATPPQLSAVRVTPNRLDVSDGNGFTRFEWDATDEGGSGVFYANISLSSPSGRQLMQGQGFVGTAGLTATTLQGDGITRTFTPTVGYSEPGLSQYSEPGTWTVNYVQVGDHARNVTTYQGAALAAIMPSPFFEVVSNPTDVVDPAITAFRFSPSSIDVSTAPQTVTVEFDVIDELSGVQAAWLTFRSPTIATASPPFLQRTATFYQAMTGPRITGGTVTGSVTFPTFDRGGDWTVSEVCVVDRVKHQKCYRDAALAALGVTTLPVISNRLSLTPAADENSVGSQHTVTATLASQTGPVSGASILFTVAGANSATGNRTTDSSGQATFTYTGVNVGVDTITACHDANTNGVCEVAELKATATKTWVPGGPAAPATLVLTPPTDTNKAGEEHCVTATVKDAAGNPTPGVKVVFSVSGANTAGGPVTTNAGGEATFCYTGTKAGGDTINAFADSDGSGSQNGTEPTGAATTTYVAAAPATLVLTPPTASNVVGTQHCVTATAKDAFGNPASGVTVRFTVTGSRTTAGSKVSDASGQATFCYAGPELPGADVIKAYADSSNNNAQDAGEPAGGATKTWVLPASTRLCQVSVTNGGRITANNGDRATFGGNAQVPKSGQPKGNEEYQDHGPAQNLNVKSTKILAVACSADKKQASIYGEATINGSGSFLFKIDVRDVAEPGVGKDTYRILLSSGYDSGEHTLEGGNIQIRIG